MKKRILIIVLVIFIILISTGFAIAMGINSYVKGIGEKYIILPEQAAELKDVDCILVLGCKVKDNGDPSDMLADRIRRGIELYESNGFIMRSIQ